MACETKWTDQGEAPRVWTDQGEAPVAWADQGSAPVYWAEWGCADDPQSSLQVCWETVAGNTWSKVDGTCWLTVDEPDPNSGANA